MAVNQVEDSGRAWIARLKITLNSIDPMPVRQVEVPLDIRLDRLHIVIQAAMGWTDTHLYEFRTGGASWGPPDPDGIFEGPLPAAKTTLEKLINGTTPQMIQYLYDFGDGWDHSVSVEQIDEARDDRTYSRLIAATEVCPPEDVGGPLGYEEFLTALADPDCEQHEDMLRWWGGEFDPRDAQADKVSGRLAQLAKKWAPKPRRPKVISLRS